MTITDLQSDRRVVVSTRRPAEATALLARTFPGIRLKTSDDGAPFLFRHTSYTDGRLRSSEVMVSGSAVETGSIPRGDVGVGLVLAGRYAAQYGRHEVDTQRPFLRPAMPVIARMQDAHVRLVTFDGDALRTLAERLEAAGGQHMRLVHTRPVSEAASAAWRWMGAHVHATLQDPRAAANPIVTAELFESAARVLLVCFGENAHHEAPSELGSSPGAVRRAVAYLEEHAAGAVTVPEVALAARVSVRSLQALFRRHLGVTPLEHLHAIRLDAARRDLLAVEGRSDAGSVREVAERWGFANSGRFARIYAGRFGERPSETLRRRP